MAHLNVRNSFKDIFGVYLLEKLSFDGEFDMPIVSNFDDISKIDYISLYSDKKDYFKTSNTCIAFYQYDHIFDGINGLYNSIAYNMKEQLNKYIQRFKDVKYIIAPDYSLFGDFPVALQIFNVYKSRICMCWLQQNTNASIIPNIRRTYSYSYNFCFDGIKKHSNIAISVLGQLKNKQNYDLFIDGFKELINRVEPKQIIAYGFINNKNFQSIFEVALKRGIKIIIPHSKIDKYKNCEAIYGARNKI